MKNDCIRSWVRLEQSEVTCAILLFLKNEHISLCSRKLDPFVGCQKKVKQQGRTHGCCLECNHINRVFSWVPTCQVVLQIPRKARIIDNRRLLYFPAPHRAFHSKAPERQTATESSNCRYVHILRNF